MILVVDNYDSFVYNLVQYVGSVAREVRVVRNDAVTIEEIREMRPDGIVVSPGPGTPEEAGVSVPVFAELSVPAFGICLGHQALCVAYGVSVGHAPSVVHGKGSSITHDARGVFRGIENPIEAGRYHSLATTETVEPPLVETARTDDERVVMGVRHREKPQFGVQFHPESILTDAGKRMVENFVRVAEGDASQTARPE